MAHTSISIAVLLAGAMSVMAVPAALAQFTALPAETPLPAAGPSVPAAPAPGAAPVNAPSAPGLSAAGVAAELERTLFGPDEVDVDACRAALDRVLTGRGIVFASGSSRMTADSAALLPAIAEALRQCPQAPVYVEGHTDSQGDAQLNLRLSIARAEAVVDGLLALGLAPERLFSIGYGASLPIASNDTAEGRQTNRRIVFAFEDMGSVAGAS